MNKKSKWLKLKPLALPALVLILISQTEPISAKETASGATQEAKITVPKDGSLKIRLPAWPKTLNSFTTSDQYLNGLYRLVSASLAKHSHETWELVPYIAEKWEVSDDRKELTFYLNKEAKFDSGNPVTAEDVKFSADILYDRKKCVTCEGLRSYIGPISKVEVLGTHKVKFYMEKSHFENLSRLADSLWIYEKKVFSKKDFNKGYNRDMAGAGPYKYDKKGSKFRKSIVLRLNENHWTQKLPYFAIRYNFKRITFKYIEDDTVALEAFKKKDFDVFYFRQGHLDFWDATDKAPFTDKNMARHIYEKINPWSWGGVALNMRSGQTSELEFRQALQLVLNREVFMSKLFNNHQKLVGGPFPEGTDYSANLEPTKYDPKKASELLKKIGYTSVDSDGILYKTVDGKKQRAEFTFMYATRAHDQWATMFKEDGKKIGIDIIPRYIDWSAAIKQIDEFKFQGFVLGWSGSMVPAPNQLWHGNTANNKGTSNMPGLNDPEVNALIEKSTTEFDYKKRTALFRELEKKIVGHQPYLFRWTGAKHKVAYWKDRVNPTANPSFKYSGTDFRDMFYVHWHTAKK